jgi:molecular chaperone GrpE
MSNSDEAVPAEEVTPESESKPESESELEPGIWSDARAAVAEAAAAGAHGTGSGSGSGDDDGVERELDPMKVLAAERDEYLLALQRVQAEFENYRKRIQRLQDEQSARAATDLVTKLLHVLDTLDLAQAHQGDSGAGSEDAKALQAARSMLLETLAKEGLERVNEAEVPFDPEVHDAVAKCEGEVEGGEPVIDEVLRSGYRWRGRVLRPAMVRVRG